MDGRGAPRRMGEPGGRAAERAGQRRDRRGPMDLLSILSPEAVLPAIRAHSKKQALQEVSERAAQLSGLPEREIFDTLLQRERLGSTGIGNGVAIPHGKLVALDRIFGVFARLDEPVPFEAIDDRPVDLLFALFAPESAGADHLKALARVARVLRSPAITDGLRKAQDRQEILALLSSEAATEA